MNRFGFDFKHLKGDLFGGLTAGVVALPLALAFGVGSGLGPDAGLYGAIFIAFFAALFGGTNTQISGPTAPMTAFSLVFIGTIIANNDGDMSVALPIILGIFILAGFMQIGMGILGLGKYIKYIPYPVVSGFMTAIGVIILVSQILPAVGYNAANDEAYVNSFREQAKEAVMQDYIKQEKKDDILRLEHLQTTVEKSLVMDEAAITEKAKSIAKSNSKGVIGSIKAIPRALRNINRLELALTLATILIIYGFKRITTVIPSALVALVVVSGVAFAAGLSYIPIPSIPSGFPKPNLEVITQFDIAALTPYIFTALLLALLGAIDSLLTSIVADNMTKTKHKSNQELIGQGIGNSIAGLFGGIPGAGATIRTVVNIQSGGKTKLSGMVAGLLLLGILLVLGPVASKIPAAVLAGILITVGIGVMDYKGLKAIPYMPRPEVAIMLIVLVLSCVWNLVYAVGVGLVIAALMFMKKIGDMTAQESDVKPLKEEAWEDEIGFPENLKEEVFIKHIKGPLFFGYTSEFQQLANQIPSTASAVVIRMERVTYMDQSGLYAMEDILMELAKNDIRILLVNLPEQPRYLMERIDMIPDLVPEDQIFDSFDGCLTWVKANVEDIFPAAQADPVA